jgi:hypothetical protein
MAETIWVDSHGTEHEITGMSDKHILNAYCMIMRRGIRSQFIGPLENEITSRGYALPQPPYIAFKNEPVEKLPSPFSIPQPTTTIRIEF